MGKESQVVFVGINPSSAVKPTKGSSMYRLNWWIKELGLPHVGFVNCCLTPGPFGLKYVDSTWLFYCLEGADKVVALGQFPAKVLRNMGIEHFTMPHPSGSNRQINDKAYVDGMLSRCRDYINS